MNKSKICFYSNNPKDKWSKVFLEELSKTPWVNEFQFVCVDPSPTRPPLPGFLKQVPTLFIKDDKEPVKTDAEVMNWLWERKMKEMPKEKKIAGPIPDGQPGGEPLSWVAGEMEGFGNSGYSYLDGNESANPGSYTLLNVAPGPGVRQGDSVGQSMQQQAARSKKEVQFDNQLEMFKRARDMDMPRGPARQ